MEPVNKNNSWCCWPFSLCCGNSNSSERDPERDPLTRSGEYSPPPERHRAMSNESVGNRSDGVRTPGTTPTKSQVVKEQRMEEPQDYV